MQQYRRRFGGSATRLPGEGMVIPREFREAIRQAQIGEMTSRNFDELATLEEKRTLNQVNQGMIPADLTLLEQTATAVQRARKAAEVSMLMDQDRRFGIDSLQRAERNAKEIGGFMPNMDELPKVA